MAEKNRSRADEIVRVATRLFSDKGYDGVSVRDICAELSVNCSIVSYYFKGKKGLYLEVLRGQFEIFNRALDEAITLGQGASDKLTAFVAAMGHMRIDFPYFPAIMIRESGSPSPEFLQIVQEYKEDRMVELIREGQRQGQLKKGARPESLAVALYFMLIGVAAAGAFGAGKQAEKDYYVAVSLLLDGLAALPEDDNHRLGKQTARPRANWSR